MSSQPPNRECMTGPEIQPEESGARPTTAPTQKARKALSHLKRELSDDDLAQQGVQKLLIDKLDEVEEENVELRGYRERFHDTDKRLAVLTEKQRVRVSTEIISGASLAIGAAALGFAPAVWDKPEGLIVAIFGAVLIILGIWAKAIRI